MALDTADQVVAMSADAIAAFIEAHVRAKTLSTFVRALNEAMLSGDHHERARAAATLDRLGLLEVA